MKCRSLWHRPAPTVRTSTSPGARVVDPQVLDVQLARLLVQNGGLHGPSSLLRR